MVQALRKNDKSNKFQGERSVSHSVGEFYEAVAQGCSGTVTVRRIESHGAGWVVMYMHHYTCAGQGVVDYRVGIVREHPVTGDLRCCIDMIAS